ncbi:hypothetical protein H4219_001568 [Mycoemilia scoparia]|uniref:Uncharacterized protein n=1 Tax=Mycoemilia scoparia TaxID=417184 RepID=A0A9W8A961_9FUNG|nr:hypothetical protein H4219_001568 [Mycoemilia scoparia]
MSVSSAIVPTPTLGHVPGNSGRYIEFSFSGDIQYNGEFAIMCSKHCRIGFGRGALPLDCASTCTTLTLLSQPTTASLDSPSTPPPDYTNISTAAGSSDASDGNLVPPQASCYGPCMHCKQGEGCSNYCRRICPNVFF